MATFRNRLVPNYAGDRSKGGGARQKATILLSIYLLEIRGVHWLLEFKIISGQHSKTSASKWAERRCLAWLASIYLISARCVFSFFHQFTLISATTMCSRHPTSSSASARAFWSYYGCEQSHVGGTGSLWLLWNGHIVNLKACRRLFDSGLMKRTRKPLVVGRLTPFSSLMRFDKNPLQLEENSFIYFLLILWFLASLVTKMCPVTFCCFEV